MVCFAVDVVVVVATIVVVLFICLVAQLVFVNVVSATPVAVLGVVLCVCWLSLECRLKSFMPVRGRARNYISLCRFSYDWKALVGTW